MTRIPFEYQEVSELPPSASLQQSTQSPLFQHLVCFGFMLAAFFLAMYGLGLRRPTGPVWAGVLAAFPCGLVAYGLHRDHRWALWATLVVSVVGSSWSFMFFEFGWLTFFVGLLIGTIWLLVSHARRAIVKESQLWSR